MLCSPEEHSFPRGDEQDDIVIIMQQEDVMFGAGHEITSSDKTSHMDNNLYVPIDLIAGFKRVQMWTTDREVIVDILKSSDVVQVDEQSQKVRPALSLQRTTIILRDIPSGTEEKEILDFLDSLQSPPVKNIKADLGMWYIAYETEKNAVEMLKRVRNKIFKGHPVAVRMKSEPMLRRMQATLQSSQTVKESKQPQPQAQQQPQPQAQPQKEAEAETCVQTSQPEHQNLSIKIPQEVKSTTGLPLLSVTQPGSHTTPMPVCSYASILKRSPSASSDKCQDQDQGQTQTQN
ncbi:hypothetical protein J3Q64DRAFT_1824298 [Phycomyces blakesleeanus]|uniref:HTH La-type RNA-binding domain-containing protein n=2 Tax=Phycomyces blakesleeanus TaxID=4837 RepID=A0A162TQG0_PHYB8|nr:hypothetical protein PHYBLDRAFT_172817 [Phycomyces blakesleeanus NRRL 1555(-)]OAD68983.1 hypothetical protein PHYBLDRAFT_172817 [Phycomyces blakesleeanus NRRL 1555(-)]|eukprot:XP_018287023.1 hypothetical protein PHYBLDRAFT_172817 [Phycomyces blakesleeanus NRRL 1555(-)]